MIQHLISATLIWALALLLYELLFRRLRHHAANRAYLLASLCLGLLLPLFSFHVDRGMPAALQTPVARYTILRQATVERMAPASDAPAQQVNWWLLIYAAGAAIATGYALYQVLALVRIRRSAMADQAYGRSFLRSSRVASPCSFFGWTILPESADYTPGELAMILRHEEEHRRLRHSADVLAMMVLRTTLWFHPLVYLYDRRLRMVHEFQADAPQRSDALAYGRLLVEQAMSGYIPLLTHAFFQSPLKTRIAMLLKTSTATRLRYLAVLLLLPVFFICTAQGGGGKKHTNHGAYFYFGDHDVQIGVATDTIKLTGATTGMESVISPGDSIPVALDNEPIYQTSMLTTQPVLQGAYPDLRTAVFSQIQPLLNTLPDGNYGMMMNSLVLDKTGKLAYGEGSGITSSPISLLEVDGEIVPGFGIPADVDTMVLKELISATKRDNKNPNKPSTADTPGVVFNAKNTVAPKLKTQIDAKIVKALEAVRYQPGLVQGKPVATAMAFDELDLILGYMIVVKNGKATLTKGFATL